MSIANIITIYTDNFTKNLSFYSLLNRKEGNLCPNKWLHDQYSLTHERAQKTEVLN